MPPRVPVTGRAPQPRRRGALLGESRKRFVNGVLSQPRSAAGRAGDRIHWSPARGSLPVARGPGHVAAGCCLVLLFEVLGALEVGTLGAPSDIGGGALPLVGYALIAVGVVTIAVAACARLRSRQTIGGRLPGGQAGSVAAGCSSRELPDLSVATRRSGAPRSERVAAASAALRGSVMCRQDLVTSPGSFSGTRSTGSCDPVTRPLRTRGRRALSGGAPGAPACCCSSRSARAPSCSRPTARCIWASRH